METVFQMRVRHKNELFDLIERAIQQTGSVIGASEVIGMDRGGIYRELHIMGKTVPQILGDL